MRKVLVATLLLALLARAQDQPLRLPLDKVETVEHWYGVYIQGKKSGYARARIVEKDGQYVAGMRIRIQIKAMNKEVKMDFSAEQNFSAEPPYRFLSGRFVQSGRGISEEKKVVRTEKGFHITGPGLDMVKPAFDYTLADALTLTSWIRKGPKVGDKVTTRSFEFTVFAESHDTFTVEEVTETMVHGVKTRHYSGSLVSSVLGPAGTMRMTADGNMASLVFGGFMEMRLEPKELAKQLEKGGDVFFNSMARLDKRIGDPRKVTELVVDISGKGAKNFKTGPGQKATLTEAGAVRLGVGGEHQEPVKATPEEIEENLEETVSFPTKHEAILALMKTAMGDATTVREKVDRLVRFVHGYVEDELRPEPVTVLQVLESKRGDCQEHSILFATLGRAAGIPTRLVTGLVYVGDGLKAFGGHAWNEVVIDGYWVPVDSTWNEIKINATHLRVGSGVRGLAAVGWAFGQIKLELVSVKPG